MTALGAAVALHDRMLEHVATWPVERREAHGFGLMYGEPDALTVRRRAHARTVLTAESVLIDLSQRSARVVVMKGLEAAQLYASPVRRPFRDLDLLVADPQELWDTYHDLGYRPSDRRRSDIDHHHLPALAAPNGRLGIEFHIRPNVPAWACVPSALVLETAEPSRTGIEGIMRPRDDLHALLMALHCWKGGFTRLRDLFDALLFASQSQVPVDRTAATLGLGRVWRWTVRFAESELLGLSTPLTRAASRAVLPRRAGLTDRKRTRILSPFLAVDPVRALRGHAIEYRLGREARRPPDQGT